MLSSHTHNYTTQATAVCLPCRLTYGNPDSHGCGHQTSGRSAADFGSPLHQTRDPLEDAAQGSQMVNTHEATACQGDVPLLLPVKHLLLSLRPPSDAQRQSNRHLYCGVQRSIAFQSSHSLRRVITMERVVLSST